MDTDVAGITAQFDQPFSVRQARAQGARRAELYDAGLSRPHHGARAMANPDRRTQIGALMVVAPEDAVLSHGSAAEWLNLPVPQRVLDQMHVSLPGIGRRIRRPGVRGHSGAKRSRIVDGVRVAHPADILADLAGDLDHLELVILADAILARWSDIELDRDLAARANVRGARRLHRAVADARRGSRSPKETECRLLFAGWGLPEPELNVDIIDGDEWFGCADFLFRLQRLIVEYYGSQHSETMQHDVQRIRGLEDRGYSVEIVVSSDLGPGRPELRRRLSRYF